MKMAVRCVKYERISQIIHFVGKSVPIVRCSELMFTTMNKKFRINSILNVLNRIFSVYNIKYWTHTEKKNWSHTIEMCGQFGVHLIPPPSPSLTRYRIFYSERVHTVIDE